MREDVVIPIAWAVSIAVVLVLGVLIGAKWG